MGNSPLQNRVTPFGEIIATTARGTLMGNRGIIHEPGTRQLLTRRWQHPAWICCVLDFKDYQHPIMGAGAYTELFFLDEATALAAGHRPCAYCRRRAFNTFKRAWSIATGESQPRAPIIDRQLHRERVTRQRKKITFTAPLDNLPDGAFIAIDGHAYLLKENRLLRWHAQGYSAPQKSGKLADVRVLTPFSTVAVLRAGYSPLLHPSSHN
ncbi:MAG: hypothetical protein OET44_08025 [Gammaproteobacteria bacterium]|nr:hypothetical protein [Gammaproteobacteria bacterium]